MKRLLAMALLMILLCGAAATVIATELAVVEPSSSAVPLLILLGCAGLIGGLIALRIKNPALYAKIAGTVTKAEEEAKATLAKLEAHRAAVAAAAPTPHSALSTQAPPAVLELPPATVGDGILR